MNVALWPAAITGGTALIGVALGTGLTLFGERAKWRRESRQSEQRERAERLEDFLLAMEEARQLAHQATHGNMAEAAPLKARFEQLMAAVALKVVRIQLVEPEEVASRVRIVHQAAWKAMTESTESTSTHWLDELSTALTDLIRVCRGALKDQ
ncbi:hypothetical protein [Streptomyces sp. NPDC004014]